MRSVGRPRERLVDGELKVIKVSLRGSVRDVRRRTQQLEPAGGSRGEGDLQRRYERALVARWNGDWNWVRVD